LIVDFIKIFIYSSISFQHHHHWDTNATKKFKIQYMKILLLLLTVLRFYKTALHGIAAREKEAARVGLSNL